VKRKQIIVAAATVLALTGCKSTPQPKPLDQLTSQEQNGHAIYSTHCAACHNDRIDRPLNGPPLLGVYKKQYLPSGAPANDERITHTIQHGRNNMPPQGNIDSDDMNDLLAYLHTL